MINRPSGTTTRVVAELNTTTIVECLRSSGPMTMQQVRHASGLSPATVSRIIDRLRGERIVIDVGAEHSSGGRPPRLLGYNFRRYSVIAIDIGARTIDGGIFDMQGRQIRDRPVTHPIRSSDDPDAATAVFEQLADVITDLVGQAEKLGSPAKAVGVGVPGIVRADTGMVQFAPSVRWWDLPLPGLLTERVGLPVVVENDVNLIALAEHRVGAARGYRNAIALAIGTGVGAGIIVDDHLYRGGQGGAGEVGYMLMDLDSLDHPWPGFGDFESRVSGRRLVERVRTALDLPDEAVTHPRDVLELIRKGDPTATSLFTEAVNYVAMALANVCAVLNPDVVVLAGGIGTDFAELAIPSLVERLRGRVPLVPAIVPGAIEYAELMGAVQLAIEQVHDFPVS